MKILILGGYGVFGGRLAELLSDLPQVEMQICGRSLTKAKAFCAGFKGVATVTPVQMDRAALDSHISTLEPDLIVDASGPFQDYGDNRYAVIGTCIRHKINYLDSADAADFVFGVSQFDDAAKAAGIFVLSGVSSFPVLTAAVLREFARDMDIKTVTGGIAPSPYAGIGLNVMRAVVSYAGEPVKLTRGGIATTAPGLAESRRYTIAVPGHVPLRNLRFSLVDVPDLQVLPPEPPTMTDIWMGAGPVPEILHRMLNVLAIARTKLRLPSLAPLSPLFYKVLNLMKFGEHRDGMFVAVTGTQNGQPVSRSWHLLAEGDDGPYIPSMAVEAIVRKMLAGQYPETGARTATRALDLTDYDALFANRTIYTGFRSDAADEPLYKQILGSSFNALPDKIQALHEDTSTRSWSGTAQVRRGTNIFAGLFANLFGFPKGASDIAIRVQFAQHQGSEKWTRHFGHKQFHSIQKAGTGRHAQLLTEKFGIVTVALALEIRDDKLWLVPRHWSVLGVPMPKVFLPSPNSHEAQVDGKFRFDVEIAVPIIGLIAAYSGTLAQDAAL